MNKSLLTVLALGTALSAVAQSNLKPLQQVDKNRVDNYQAGFAANKLQKPASILSPQGVSGFTLTKIDIGISPNAYTCGFGPKTYLWADPSLNAVSFSHRGTGVPTTLIGLVNYSASKDGGATWPIIDLNAYLPEGEPLGANFSAARYPQGLIYSPVGNTNVDSAYFAYFAPTRNNTNPGPNSADWGGIGYGVHQLSGLLPARQREMKSITAPNKAEFHLIPDGMYTSQQGVVWALDQSNNQNAANGYRDTLNLFQGFWNAGTRDIDYLLKKIPAPMSTRTSGNAIVSNYIDCRIAFAPNGQIGWISILGHNSYAARPDSGFYPILYKTINGGTNWTGPYSVDINGLAAVTAIGGTTFTTGFEHDLVVDVNGNPYVTCAIGKLAPNWAISSGPGNWGHFVVYSPNGGTNWHAEMLDKSQTFRGTFGAGQNAVNEDGRPQASTNWAGDKLFFAWFDTDTFSNAGVGNLAPDLYVRGFDVTANMWTARRPHPLQGGVMTFGVTIGGTPCEFEVTMGNLSYYVFTNGATSEVPVSYMKLVDPGNAVSPTTHHYIKGITYNDVDFVVPTDTVGLLNGLKPYEKDNFAFGVNPNPFKDNVSIKYNLLSNSNVTIEIFNILGERVMNLVANQNQSAGEHKYNVDLSKYNSGIYIVKAKLGNETVTRKITQY